MLDRHIDAGPHLECCRSLEEHHAEAVHVLAAHFLCDAQELCLCGSIDCVSHNEVGAQIGLVWKPCHTFERLHAAAGRIGKKIAALDLSAESYMILQVKELCLAVGLLIDLPYGFFRIRPEFILNIENRDLGNTIQSSLDLDCSGGTACADNCDLFADDINIIIL